MKKIICILLWSLISSSALLAQEGLNINKVFDGRFRNSPNAVETIVTGKKMQSFNLTLYHSLTVKDDVAATALIEQLVRKDGVSAIDKEVVFKDGHLYYGFYTFTPQNKINRYLFFLNQQQNNKVVVIYMEGKATMKEIKNMIKNN